MKYKKRALFYTSFYGALAQLARASHWQCEGQRFESAMLHHFYSTSVQSLTTINAFAILLIHTLLSYKYLITGRHKTENTIITEQLPEITAVVVSGIDISSAECLK